MKRTLTVIASLLLVVSLAGIASAEMVSIGVAAIDKSIDDGIRARVARVNTPAVAATPQPAAPVNIGVAEIDAADYGVLQDYVSGRKEMPARSGMVAQANPVDIGVVAMSDTDLKDLEKMTSWMKGKNPGQMLIDRLHARLK